jgi:hypothetical protein
MTQDVAPHTRQEKPSSIAEWPLWKVVVLALAGYGPLAALLYLSSLVPPPFRPDLIAAVSILIVTLGIFLAVWASRRPGWAPRAGGTALLSLLFLALGTRFWAMLVNGLWFWVVTLPFVLLYVLAWLLPAISASLSTALWREQVAPQTGLARRLTRWTLALGLGGAGAVGASVGTSLIRTGGGRLAFLIVALGMSILAVLIAQGFSHQLWPDSPWAKRANLSNKHGER